MQIAVLQLRRSAPVGNSRCHGRGSPGCARSPATLARDTGSDGVGRTALLRTYRRSCSVRKAMNLLGTIQRFQPSEGT